MSDSNQRITRSAYKNLSPNTKEQIDRALRQEELRQKRQKKRSQSLEKNRDIVYESVDSAYSEGQSEQTNNFPRSITGLEPLSQELIGVSSLPDNAQANKSSDTLIDANASILSTNEDFVDATEEASFAEKVNETVIEQEEESTLTEDIVTEKMQSDRIEPSLSNTAAGLKDLFGEEKDLYNKVQNQAAKTLGSGRLEVKNLGKTPVDLYSFAGYNLDPKGKSLKETPKSSLPSSKLFETKPKPLKHSTPFISTMNDQQGLGAIKKTPKIGVTFDPTIFNPTRDRMNGPYKVEFCDSQSDSGTEIYKTAFNTLAAAKQTLLSPEHQGRQYSPTPICHSARTYADEQPMGYMQSPTFHSARTHVGGASSGHTQNSTFHSAHTQTDEPLRGDTPDSIYRMAHAYTSEAPKRHTQEHLSPSERNLIARQAIEIIPRFGGNSEQFDHFSGMCNEARSMIPNYSDHEFVTLVRGRLTGQAQAMVIGKIFNNLTELLTYLKKLFSPCRDFIEVIGALENMYQKSDESVLSYSARIREVARRMAEESEFLFSESSNRGREELISARVTEKFIQGLKRELRSGVTTRDDLDTAVQEAIREERQLLKDKLLTGYPSETKKPERVEKSARSNPSWVRQVVEACQECDSPSHTARNCPSVSAQRPANSQVTCQFCTRTGHTAKNCYALHPNLKPNNFNRNGQMNNGFNMRPRPNYYCDFCQRPGHSNERCFKKSQGSTAVANSTDLPCKCCDRMGHLVQDCPLLEKTILFCKQTTPEIYRIRDEEANCSYYPTQEN